MLNLKTSAVDGIGFTAKTMPLMPTSFESENTVITYVCSYVYEDATRLQHVNYKIVHIARAMRHSKAYQPMPRGRCLAEL
jgi:hypothetical protein